MKYAARMPTWKEAPDYQRLRTSSKKSYSFVELVCFGYVRNMQYNKQLQTKTDIFFNVHGSVHRKNIRIYKKEFFLNLCTGMSLTETDDTRCCINTC